MRSRRRVWILLINLISISIVFALFEAGTRVWAPPWLRYRMQTVANAGNLGGSVGWRSRSTNGTFLSFEPHSTFACLMPEYQHQVHIDELGGRQTLFGSSHLTPNIVALGDSFTFGIGVKDEETFLAQLERSLGQRILNLGVPGSSLPIQRLILERRHAELGHPRLYLVFVFLGNDIADIVYWYRKHSETGGAGSNSVQPIDDPNANPIFRRINSLSFRFPFNHSYLIQFFRQKIHLKLLAKHRSFQDPVFMYMNKTETNKMTEARCVIGVEVAKWRELKRDAKTEFLFVLLPDRNQVSKHSRQLRASGYGIEEGDLDPDLPARPFLESFARCGFKCIDATPWFTGVTNAEDLYYIADNHFKPAGHALVAARLAPILQKTLLKK